MGRVVVGFDGSPGSELALRFALGEARLRSAGLRVVCAWEAPVAAYAGLAYVPAFDLREVEEAAAGERVAQALALLGEAPGVPVEAIAAEGHPANVLVEQSAGADLLVVGSRGHGSFSSLLLGSVGQAVAHHARTPVAIVPSPRGS